MTTGADAFGAIDLFERLVSEAKSLIAADEQEIDSLIREIGEMRERLDGLVKRRSAMDNRTRTPLSLLKMAFSIEASHMGNGSGKIFDSVSSSISELGDKLKRCMEVQFAALEAATQSMEAIGTRLVKMREDARRQHGEAREQFSELQSRAGQLRQARHSQKEMGQRITESSECLQGEFNRVMMALQYHDITRQQLEHVGRALEKMREWVPRQALPEAEAMTVSGLLHQSSVLQLDQTRAALDSLHAAGTEFVDGMKGIRRHAGELAGHVLAFRNLCASESVFRALSSLRSLSDLIAERAEIKREVGEAGCQGYQDVTDLTATIQDLTVDLRLLAVNVQIQAANSGNRSVVDALARQICEISEASQQGAEEIASGMQRIKESLSALAHKAWTLGTQRSPEGRVLADGVPRCVELLTRMQTDLTERLDAVQVRQDGLRERIEQMLPRVHFPETASRRLSNVLEFFAEIETCTHGAAGNSRAHRSVFEGFEKGYTMASERKIHEAHHGAPTPGVAADREVSVELFESSGPAPKALRKEEATGAVRTVENEPVAATQGAAEDFGDNIELF